MQKTPLYQYLEQFASGDEEAVPKLCEQLADRLIYVPILQTPDAHSGGAGMLTVRIARVDDGEKKRVPIFTTEKHYKSWAAIFSQKTKFISLLGGDFCAALSPDTNVVIDPGAAYSATLKPDYVKLVSAAVSDESKAGTLPAPIPETLRGRSEPTSFMQRPKMIPPKEEGQGAEASKNGLFAGAFGVGSEEGAQDAQGQGSEQAAGGVNRPVIFSSSSDSNRVVLDKQDPNKKKRRSFLKFLTGD